LDSVKTSGACRRDAANTPPLLNIYTMMVIVL
jgi:hypothetical protein